MEHGRVGGHQVDGAQDLGWVGVFEQEPVGSGREGVVDLLVEVKGGQGERLVATHPAYLWTRKARALLASRTEARRPAAVDEVMAAYQRDYAIARCTVWPNLPPAHVWHLRRPADR
ncbi:hypothetical protein ACTMTI_47840 [Nonomuraea sp. H19]|uniref:hypothetical protein n=1 Tax=Nonomuraea sp. H19 TaxID=3452206 RepID=UPI003F8A4F93